MASTLRPYGNTAKKPHKETVKAQSSVEYLSTFSVALVIIALVVVVIGLIIYGNRSITYSNPSCYLSAQLNCVQLAIANNGFMTKAVLIFTNNLGVPISFGANSLAVLPTSVQTGYEGSCYPSSAPSGSTVICNATLSGYSPSIGTQLQPRFQISYSECQGSTCSSYSTTGQSNIYVSASAPIYSVLILTSPTSGHISINGAEYASGSVLQLIGDGAYEAYADSPPGYSFSSWIYTGGVIASLSTSPAPLSVTSSGTLEATFVTSATTLPTTPPTTSTIIPGTYTLLAKSDPSNGGTVTVAVSGGSPVSGTSVDLQVASGTSVTITTTPTSTPSPGWASGGYSSPNSMGVTSSSSSITFTMPAQNIVEYAPENPCIQVDVKTWASGVGGSGQTGSGNTEECDPQGSSVTLVAAPGNPLNAVGYWACSGNIGGTAYDYPSSSTNATCYSHAFPVTTGAGDKTVASAITDLEAPTTETVAFYPCLDFSASPAAGGSPADTAGNSHTCDTPGTTYTFASNPSTGYAFTSWGGAGDGGNSYTGSSASPTIAIDSYTVETAYYNKNTNTALDNGACAGGSGTTYSYPNGASAAVCNDDYNGSYGVYCGYKAFDCITPSGTTQCLFSFVNVGDSFPRTDYVPSSLPTSSSDCSSITITTYTTTGSENGS